jgi:osmotically-inducible protein OsmY
MPMLGCVFGLIRWVVGLALLVLLVGAGVYYFRLHPERAPWRGGIDGVRERALALGLQAKVKAALELRASLRDLPIDVSAEKDVVTLRGRAPSRALALEAEKVAQAVPGVRQVVSLVEIAPRAEPGAGPLGATTDDRSVGERLDDQALGVRIAAALELDRALRDIEVDIVVRRGDVRVATARIEPALAARLREVVQAVDGVKSVTLTGAPRASSSASPAL